MISLGLNLNIKHKFYVEWKAIPHRVSETYLGGKGGALLVQCYDKRNEITRRKFALAAKAYFNIYTRGGGGGVSYSE